MSRIVALIVYAAFWFAAACVAVAQQTDAVSREISVLNNHTPPVVVNDALSREVAVFNDLTNPVVIVEATSREISASNGFACSGNLTADGLVTPLDIPVFTDVVLGVITDANLRHAADVNCDGVNDARDISPFVVLLVTP